MFVCDLSCAFQQVDKEILRHHLHEMDDALRHADNMAVYHTPYHWDCVGKHSTQILFRGRIRSILRHILCIYIYGLGTTSTAPNTSGDIQLFPTRYCVSCFRMYGVGGIRHISSHSNTARVLGRVSCDGT